MLERALKKARTLVEKGWAEPFSLDGEGRITWPFLGDADRFSVIDALAFAAEEPDEAVRALSLLEQIACPGYVGFNAACVLAYQGEIDGFALAAAANVAGVCDDLQAWLERPTRTLDHVLRLFDKAALRARATA